MSKAEKPQETTIGSPGPRYTPIVQGLPATVPFVGPEAQERARGQAFRARIGANESVFGPSPRAVKSMQHAAQGVWQYGDPENHDLREALAAHHGVTPQNIVVGEGIDGLLGFLARLLVEPGTPVVTSDGAYPTFNYHVVGFGGRLVKVPYHNDAEDLEALAKATKAERAALVYVANPDNPMGSWHGADAMITLMDTLPGDTVLCFDEAYAEFAPQGTVPSIDVTRPNVIRFRTFSKAHGMAGARIGYAIAHSDLILSFEKIRNHFGVNRIAQAGALAALQDQDWLASVIAKVAAARDRISNIAQDNGLTPLPSAANFVTIDCGADGAFAKKVLAGLIVQGCFVRMPFVAPQDRCIRVTAGTGQALDIFAEALPIALDQARKVA
jgi:histidinol-phosphate aminotransferase